MDSVLLSKLTQLSDVQKTALKRGISLHFDSLRSPHLLCRPGGILNVAEFMLTSPNDLAKKCKVSPLEVKCMREAVCRETFRQARLLEEVKHEGDEMFTTGDTLLDNALGGGIRTGMVWEVAGERYATSF